MAPFTPRRHYADVPDSAPSSSSTKRASSSNQPPAYKSAVLESPPDPKTFLDVVRPSHTTQPVTSRLKSLPSNSPVREAPRQQTATTDVTSASHKRKSPTRTQPHLPRVSAHSQPPISSTRTSQPVIRSEPRQIFIRRVHAVVQVPVKEEDMEEELLDPSEASTSASVSASLFGSGSIPVDVIGSPSHKRRAPPYIPPRKSYGRNVVQSDEEEDSSIDNIDEAEKVDPNEDGGSPSEQSDDDDELMMGAEVSRVSVVRNSAQTSSG